MSYILDALKKAERQRGLATVPTVSTMHRTPIVTGWTAWPWIAAAVLLANAAVLVWVLRPDPEVPERATRTGASAPALSDQRATAQNRITKPDASSALPPAMAAASPRADSVAPRTIPATEQKAKLTPGAKSSVVAAPAPAPPAPSPSSVTRGTEAQPSVSSTPPAMTAEKPTPASPTAAVAKASDTSTAPAVAPALVNPGEASATTAPARGDAVASAPDLLPQIHLQMLVYSDVASERLVFINNHKYVEGQSVEGKLVVEKITPDGAVVNYQGKRLLLRADPPVAR
jgi:general secretion pathway protein B